MATRLSLSSAALLCVALTGCDGDDETRCGPGTELVARRCVPIDGSSGSGAGSGAGTGSGSSDDGGVSACGEGTYDDDGVCKALKAIGAACENGDECASGGCLSPERGAVGGYCTIAGCSDNRRCPAGSHCTYSSRDEMTVCLAYCNEEDDCRGEGYACQPLYTIDVNVCAPRCSEDSCPSGTQCEESSGKCVIHECVPGEGGCGVIGLFCYADRRGLTTSGGVCLPLCDPAAPEATCDGLEVCQPLPDGPGEFGICAPPVCETSEDCPAGATCADAVCHPPVRCDDDGECSDEDAVCVGGAGGQCVPACPEDGECTDIHSGLTCSAALGACLPVGSFPGSECRSDLNSPCDPLSVKREDGSTTVTDLLCENGVCLAACADGGSDLCADISATLSCAQDAYDAPVCLPAGTYPGGPCGAEDACAAVAVGSGSLPMACERDRCLIVCDDGAGGDVLCEGIDASLVCVDNLFGDGVDVCLPRGSIPGGPCAAGNTCDAGMACEDDRCLYDCSTGGQAVCTAADPSGSLACAVGIYDTPVCLPKGSFPGGPCATGDLCAQDLGGLGAADMFCQSGVCVIQCQSAAPFSSGDNLCATVNPALTCVNNPATDFCAPACVSGMCPTGQSCLGSENACLPTGSFLGSPCAGGTTCSGAPMLVCVPGASPTCGPGCTGPQGASAYCGGVATAYGTTWDTCADVNPAAGELLLCIDAP